MSMSIGDEKKNEAMVQFQGRILSGFELLLLCVGVRTTWVGD
jgi:hypothetical protein